MQLGQEKRRLEDAVAAAKYKTAQAEAKSEEDQGLLSRCLDQITPLRRGIHAQRCCRLP